MAEEKQLNARFQNKTDTHERWTEAGEKGFTPKKGEIIVYQEEDSRDSKIKIGNGSTAIHNLPFIEGQSSGGVADAVLYTRQDLTDDKKVQARTNIGAISMEEVEEIISQKTQVQIITWEVDD